jgi:hypothetical protein
VRHGGATKVVRSLDTTSGSRQTEISSQFAFRFHNGWFKIQRLSAKVMSCRKNIHKILEQMRKKKKRPKSLVR